MLHKFDTVPNIFIGGKHLGGCDDTFAEVKTAKPVIMLADLKDIFFKLQIRSMVKSNKVMIFSKSFCPDCKKLKEELDKKGIEYRVFEVDKE